MSPSARRIVELNIDHFRRLLETETDPAKRKAIKQLLAEQEKMLMRLVNGETG